MPSSVIAQVLPASRVCETPKKSVKNQWFGSCGLTTRLAIAQPQPPPLRRCPPRSTSCPSTFCHVFSPGVRRYTVPLHEPTITKSGPAAIARYEKSLVDPCLAGSYCRPSVKSDQVCPASRLISTCPRRRP